jgi:transposase
MHEAAAEDATFINVRAEISLHLLAYNMKRVMRILGMGPLMAAIQT